MFIRSERLFLRPGWPEDWEDLQRLIGDEQVVRNLASVPWPYTGAHARSFVNLQRERLCPGFMITLPGAAGARLIGGVGFQKTDAGVALGYWIARDHWGRGYASEAARAALSLACTLGHERIVATHFLDNPASGRVLDKLGFRRTGRIVERFSEGRGMVYPAREYELVFDSPGGCADGDDDVPHRRAA
ncbi:GNAT family N-acetyltransferase [Novosphingobium mangrovi (ex Huang et al. 2023)]|uniref:GNAT family N-acetyltransferase n=1 Tax=Novosphingobium mangrovi (ex Huang et al. 2023) TaxID=2976432 RepID=A0ABT2I0E6_9SPHN|nr:GNAT family N-acetyltransferase [Novosphingobium mangrovi (ex Huang et al. 2023)]MCT2398273.1 GNAT family N-acetyltransferase [Novosphingobium mangrovi (ex Huang et al. 2023)]